MNDATKEASVDASLINLIDRKLLLPSSAIVAVQDISMPQVMAKMPKWFLGFLPWQKLRIPFISFEAVCGASYKINVNSHILILKTTTVSLQSHFYAMLIQDLPLVCTITKQSVVDVVGELTKYELENVKINEFTAKIPNIPELEKLLIDTGVLA